MLEGILQGLCEWIYGLFLDLIAYCANALLGVMTTDLTFWETSVAGCHHPLPNLCRCRLGPADRQLRLPGHESHVCRVRL